MTASNNKRIQKQTLSYKGQLLRLLLSTALLGSSLVLAQEEPYIGTILTETKTSSMAQTSGQGLQVDQRSRFVKFNGSNGLELPISLPQNEDFDYTIMFWFRSAQDLVDLARSSGSGKDTLFEVAGGPACYIENASRIQCTPVKVDEAGNMVLHVFDLSIVPDIQAWIHFTYSTNHVPGTDDTFDSYSYMRIDTLDRGWVIPNGGFAPLASPKIYYGIDAGRTSGFIGDMQELYVAKGYLAPENVPFIMNQAKVIQLNVLGYYKFDMDDDELYRDAFRPQEGEPVYATGTTGTPDNVPVVQVDGAASNYCQSIASKTIRVPRMEDVARYWEELNIPEWEYEERRMGYTVSMWIKNEGVGPFTKNPRGGREAVFLMKVEETFTLWFDSQNSIRAYIFADDNFMETYSDAIYLPPNQWVNLQVTLDDETGITMITFNQNGEQIQLVSNPIYLAEQRPFQPRLWLFNSFIGQIYTLNMWDHPIEIPLTQEKVDNSTDYTLIDLQFTIDKFNDGWASAEYPETVNITTKFGEGWQWEYTTVPSNANVGAPTSYGQLDASMTNWATIVCPNPTENQYYINGAGSFFSQDVILGVTDRMTVEFWFRADLSQTQGGQAETVLFSLYNRHKDSVAMEIFVHEADGLICAPFGRGDALTQTYLKYGINPLTSEKWHHISCSYIQELYVIGEIVSYNLNDFTSAKSFNDARLPQKYSISLVNDKSRNLNYIQELTFRALLGSDPKADQSVFGSYKDVRIWSTVRHDTDLYTYRVKQVPTDSEGLIANFKLMDGNHIVQNEATMNSKKVDLSSAGINTQWIASDGENTVCSSSMYFNPDTRMCTRFPYNSEIPIVYTVVNNVQHGHQMQLNRYTKSTMTLPGEYQPDLKPFWRVDDDEVANKFLTGQESMDTFSFDPIYMRDGQEYVFGLKLLDEDEHGFYQDKSQTVVPRKCLRIADTESDEPYTEHTFIKGEEVDDMCFKFRVKDIDGCFETFESELSDRFTLQTQPPIDQSTLDMNQYSVVDRDDRIFQSCIPSSVIMDDLLPMNIPVEYIFTVFWRSLEPEKGKSSYMSVIYHVTYVDEITPSIVLQGKEENVIDVMQETAIFDASASAFTATQRTEGLIYRWNCPDIFQDYCEEFEGVEILAITPEVFTSYGGEENTEYTFTIETYTMMIGGDPTMEAQVFSESLVVRWAQVQPPQFTIELQKNSDAEADVYYVTKRNEFLINLANYRSSDPILDFTYYITPEVDLNISGDNSVLIIEADTLDWQTTYTLTVTVTNTATTDQVSISNDLQFTTGEKPIAGTISVSPNSGVMFETPFTITLSGFSSSNVPMSYDLYGVTQLSPLKRLKLTPVTMELTEEQAVVTGPLPYLVGLQAEVFDSVGEVSVIDGSITIQRSEQQDWSAIAEAVIADNFGESKWQFLSFASFQANQDASVGKTSYDDAIYVNSLIAAEAYKDVQLIPFEDDSEETQRLVKLIVTSLAEISQYRDFMSVQMAIDSSNALEYIQRLESAIDKMNDDTNFVYNFVESLGNILKYSSRKAEFVNVNEDEFTPTTESGRRRRDLQDLDSDTAEEVLVGLVTTIVETEERFLPDLLILRDLMKKLIVIKNKQLDLLCNEIDATETQLRVQTTFLEIVATKFSTSSATKELRVSQSDPENIVIFPMDEFLRQSTDLDASATEVCIQASFMNTNPAAGYVMPSQYTVNNGFYIQMDSLDNNGNRLLSNEDGFQYLSLTPFEIIFKYDYPEGYFFNNQTICMSFNGNYEDLVDQKWEQRKCATLYAQDKQDNRKSTLICKCTQVQNFYQAIITDRTRALFVPEEFFQSFNWQIILIIIPLFLMGCCCPCVLLWFDKRDYEDLEMDIYEIDQDVAVNFAKKRNAICVQEVYYNFKEIEQYQKIKEFRSGSSEAFWTYMRTMHPVYSLFARFDIKLKRLIRFCVVLLQVCVITMLCWACYWNQVRDWEIFTTVGDYKAFYASLLFGVLTLPVPKFFLSCFKLEIYMMKAENNEEPGKGKGDDEGVENADDLFDVGEQSTEANEKKAVLIDQYMQLKPLFLVVVAICYISTMTASIILWINSGNEGLATENSNAVELTDSQAWEMVAMWYMAVFLWGWFFYNQLRVHFISKMAPNAAKDEYAMIQSGEDVEGCCATCSIATCCVLPREAVEIGVDIHTVMDIINNRNKYQTETPGRSVAGGGTSGDIEMSANRLNKKPGHLNFNSADSQVAQVEPVLAAGSDENEDGEKKKKKKKKKDKGGDGEDGDKKEKKKKKKKDKKKKDKKNESGDEGDNKI